MTLTKQGQAIVEYLLILAAVVSIATLINMGFRSLLGNLWGQFYKVISAPCPECQLRS